MASKRYCRMTLALCPWSCLTLALTLTVLALFVTTTGWPVDDACDVMHAVFVIVQRVQPVWATTADLLLLLLMMMMMMTGIVRMTTTAYATRFTGCLPSMYCLYCTRL